MKIGLILECQPPRDRLNLSADDLICRHIINLIAPQTQVEPEFLLNQDNLVQRCGDSAKLLFDEKKCDCVIILWDLQPLWKKYPNPQAKRLADISKIMTSLSKAGLPSTAPIYLVCLEYELESWFIIDRVILSTAFPGKNITAYPKERHWTRLDPKTILGNYFAGGYSATTVQVKRLLRGLDNAAKDRLERNCRTFKEFVNRVQNCGSPPPVIENPAE